VELDGRTGTNGLGMSGSHRSGTSNACGAVGIYGNGMKGVPRPRSPRSSYARRHAKTIGLLVLVSAIAVVSSAVALVPLSKGDAAQPAMQDKLLSRTPQMWFGVLGYCWDTVNGTPLEGVQVTVTNTNTLQFEVYTTLADGYFSVDISNNNPNFMPDGYADGNIITVSAVKGTYSGSGESGVVDTSLYVYLWRDVTLTDTGIPEFPMVIVPVIGMVALVAVMSLRRRSNEL
jgi:hypothetical protein